MKKILFLQFSLLIFFLPQAQQKTANKFLFSFDAGAGFYHTVASPKQGINGKGSTGISYLFSASYYFNKNILKVRYLNHDESILAAFDFAGPYPSESLIEYGLLYGKQVLQSRKTSIKILAGIGYLKGNIRGKYIPYQPPPRPSNQGMNDWLGPLNFGDEYEIEKISVPSLIQEVEFHYYPSKHFAFGASITGNINSKNSHWACFLKLCIGNYK